MELHHSPHRPTTSPDKAIVLRNVAADWLQTGIQLLQSVLTTDAQLTTVSSLVPGSTVGKHLRHLHDHFRILLDAVVSPDNEVDYDSRGRNTPMETSISVALKEFCTLRERLLNKNEELQQIPSSDLPLRLSATTPHSLQFHTSFGRELWFASLHAIHHYALIRVIVTGELGLQLPHDFGVAPSTIANNEATKNDKAKM
ncbi:hypothetical protein DFH28DRAFT_943781 [Melampsora americana]|nr:hypothetical protein DFH28DRAFT_943781 [Melampsora americana]